MATSSRKKSHVEEMCEDNSIFTGWTQQWGMMIRPWYSADKLIFSFVEKGTAGKGKSFDIYMDTIRPFASDFSEWAYDILHDRRLESILAAEAKAGEKYPKHYKYITGEKGEKSLGICNSTRGGYCINASAMKNGEKVFCNIPVRFQDLRMIAEMFEKTYADRLSELCSIRAKAESSKTERNTEPTVNDSAIAVSNATVDQVDSETELPISNPTVDLKCYIGVIEKEFDSMTLHKMRISTGETGNLYIKKETGFVPKTDVIYDIKAEKKGSDYLFLSA